VDMDEEAEGEKSAEETKARRCSHGLRRSRAKLPNQAKKSTPRSTARASGRCCGEAPRWASRAWWCSPLRGCVRKSVGFWARWPSWRFRAAARPCWHSGPRAQGASPRRRHRMRKLNNRACPRKGSQGRKRLAFCLSTFPMVVMTVATMILAQPLRPLANAHLVGASVAPQPGAADTALRRTQAAAVCSQGLLRALRPHAGPPVRDQRGPVDPRTDSRPTCGP
jgi:hypothetical protein